MQPARNPRKVCSRIGFAFAAMMLMVLCAQFVLSLLATNFAPWFVRTEVGYWLLADSAIYLFGAPVFLLILHTIPNGQEGPREKLRMNPLRYILVLVVCLGVAYAASLVTVIFLLFVETFKTAPVQTPQLFGDTSFPVSVFFGAVVPALGEEFLFRYSLRKKLRGAGDKIYIILSALCFAVFHMNMSQLVFTFFVGAIFAWIYTQTGSIWYSVSLHFLFNSVSLVLTQLEERLYGILVAYVGVMFIFIAISVTSLVLSLRYVRAHLRPPEEAGWPYKRPVVKYPPAYQPVAWPAPYGTPYAYQPPPYAPAHGTYGTYAPYGYPAQPPQPPGGAPYQPYYAPYAPQPPYVQPQPYAPQPYMQPAAPNYGYPAPQGLGYHSGLQPQGGGQFPGQAQPAPAACPELTCAAYNNMPQNQTPPAYQNMRPVWPGEGGPGGGAQPAAPFGTQQPSLFGPQRSNSIFKTCFLNPGMAIYLLGGFAVILISLVL